MILSDYNQFKFEPGRALSHLNIHSLKTPFAIPHHHNGKEIAAPLVIARLDDLLMMIAGPGRLLPYIPRKSRNLAFNSILCKPCRNKVQEIPAIAAQRSIAQIPVSVVTSRRGDNQDGIIGSNGAQRTGIGTPAHFQICGFPLKLLEFPCMNDIVASFHEYFEVIDVDSPELLRDVFHLRYLAYCIEQRAPGFEASNYPEEMESDGYDRHSSHILLRHRPSGEFVGTARLILPDPLGPERLFPIEQHTPFDPALFDISTLPRQHIAEVSRLIIVRRFRRRGSDREKFEREIVVEGSDIKKLRRFPHPMLALVVGLMRMSVAHDITHWLSIMDPALNRLLGHYGLQHDPAGPITEHHGQRRPYYVSLTSMLDRMYENHNQIWELLTDYGRVRPMCVERAPMSSSVSTVLAFR